MYQPTFCWKKSIQAGRQNLDSLDFSRNFRIETPAAEN
jgi:hypothetical protein